MKPCDPKINDLLNQILKNELTAINQYFLHARMLDDWGLSELAKHERSESIDEMQHAEALIDRILYYWQYLIFRIPQSRSPSAAPA